MLQVKQDGRPWLAAVCSHFEIIITAGTDRYGPRRSPAWAASLDTRTRAYPESAPKARAGQRVYRDIDTPFGSSIYWDQPLLAAACETGRLTGDPRYATAADAYIRDFLDVGIHPSGLFEWGNHIYYDMFTDQVVRFHGGPHEMRPIPPAWELFWRLSPEATDRAIRAAGRLHVFDPATGGFNRHADQKAGCAFLETGGILAESLAWLGRKTGDERLFDDALRIARYSYSHRGAPTGLLENNPTETRWDKHMSTTEVGLWGGSLLRAADYSGRPEFAAMAEAAVAAWLKYGYDSEAGLYYGKLRVADGTAVASRPDEVPGLNGFYQPATHADVWNSYFPTHDYPMAMAETCVSLFRRTGASVFGEAVGRWADGLARTPPPAETANGHGEYAEAYGRAIYFLLSASDATGAARYRGEAEQLAGQALRRLYDGSMFRSHAGEDRVDAVDGLGYLFLALLRLQSGKAPDGYGFGF